jgi:hypothetical protein
MAWYQHNNRIADMPAEEIALILAEEEKRLRTGAFRYVEADAFQDQVKLIKETWPLPARELCRDKAREFAQGQPITAAVIRRAMIATAEEMIAPRRAIMSGFGAESEFRAICGETSLATLFRMAPDATLDSVPKARTYAKGKSVRVKAARLPKRLVVNVDEAASAYLYVLAFHVDELKRGILVGWATQEDVRSAKAVNRTTDFDCNWSKMAHCLPLEKLRPMKDFLSAFGLTEIPSGFLMEVVTQRLPLPMRRGFKAVFSASQEAADFLS